MSNTDSPFLDVNDISVYTPDQKLSASNLKNLLQHIKHIPQFADSRSYNTIAVQKQNIPCFIKDTSYDINFYLYSLIEAGTAEELESKKASIEEELVLYKVNYQNQELSMEIISKPSVDGVTYIERGMFEIAEGSMPLCNRPFKENPIGDTYSTSDEEPNFIIPLPAGFGDDNLVCGLSSLLGSDYYHMYDSSFDDWSKTFARSFGDANYVDYRPLNLELLQKNGAILLDEDNYNHYEEHLPLKVIVGQIKSGDSFDDVVFCDNDYIYGWAINWQHAYGNSTSFARNKVYPAAIPLQDVDMDKLKKQFDMLQVEK